jgi:ABC-type multidrug transport system fused ATPase/permease subunit
MLLQRQIVVLNIFVAPFVHGSYFSDMAPNITYCAVLFLLATGMAGLAISLALGVTQSLNWSVRMASDLESQMVAVERLENFSSMEQEAAHVMPLTDPADDSLWPTQGDIKMTNVSMRYR